MAGKYKITQKENIKILGYILNNNLNHQPYINSIISKVNHRMFTINLISKYMSVEVRRIVLTSIIKSVVRYAAVMLLNVNAKQLNTLNVLINKIG